MQLWHEATGNDGLTQNEMDDIAKEAGESFERHILRSIIYQQKKIGRVVVRGDRYFWMKAPQDEARLVLGDATSLEGPTYQASQRPLEESTHSERRALRTPEEMGL